jgi:hypothetical protein
MIFQKLGINTTIQYINYILICLLSRTTIPYEYKHLFIRFGASSYCFGLNIVTKAENANNALFIYIYSEQSCHIGFRKVDVKAQIVDNVKAQFPAWKSNNSLNAQ